MIAAFHPTRPVAATWNRAPLIRPPSWEPFYQLRARRFVPVGGIIRIAMSSGLTLGNALEIPQDVDPSTLDLSVIAGLDAFVIFDGEREPYRRVRDVANAALRSNPASLQLWDAPPNLEPRTATLKRASYPRRYRLETARWVN
jgi:hypothetical protein